MYKPKLQLWAPFGWRWRREPQCSC